MPLSNTSKALIRSLSSSLLQRAADEALGADQLTIDLSGSGLSLGVKLGTGPTIGVENAIIESGLVSGRIYLREAPKPDDTPLTFPLFGLFALTLDAFSITVERNRITEWVISGELEFPAFWNHDKGSSTAVVRATDLRVHEGRVSGTLELVGKEGLDPPDDALIRHTFGSGFEVALNAFKLTLNDGAVTESSISGELTIPGFQTSNGDAAIVTIDVAIHQDGDFDITAQAAGGIGPFNFRDVFDLTLTSVYLGREDDDFFLGIGGTITFTHPTLSELDPIEIEKLLIWSDGRFEIEGGTIPLPNNIVLPLGPAEISISSIHLGSHQQGSGPGARQYRYFGFDGGLDINPGGVNARGRGIKFYFSVDDGTPDSYLEIKSLAIDLVIPGNASRETATLLVSGFLSFEKTAGGEPEYGGSVEFALPKAQIAGGASIKYRPKTPAFLVDASLELSTPIPLAATGAGFYGFQGLFGYRYVADKELIGLDAGASWFDFYKADQEGLNISKFRTPESTGSYDNPISIGAGVSLATTHDSGRTFSSKLFLLLSLPDLIFLEGKANILGERVGLVGDDPPFFAFLAFSSQSIEMGFGVDYQLPREGGGKGKILDLNAEMRAAFFFRNSSAWYLNFGTEQNPNTARILSLFDAYAYVMLSASGIRAGAGVTYGFSKRYAGIVRASVGVYIKVGGYVSFERPQIGGYAMLGGHVDVELLGFGFYIGIDTSLSVEVPDPFYIKGSVRLCVGVKLVVKKIRKCFNVEFKWENGESANTTPVIPLNYVCRAVEGGPLSAINMLSGETFRIASLGSQPPSGDDVLINEAVLPLDTWIDIEFLKGLNPSSAVDERIGRLSGAAPANYVDLIPPAEVDHKVRHEYEITAFEILAWNENTGAWVDYRPYRAMSNPDALAALSADPSAYKDGYWQNTGAGFNKLRLLSETSLSYMRGGEPGWYVPEEFGITGATLFCATTLRDRDCLDWSGEPVGTVYDSDSWHQLDTGLFRISGEAGVVVDGNTHVDIDRSLVFAHQGTFSVVFNEPSVSVELSLTTFSAGVVIRFFRREQVGTLFTYVLAETRELSRTELLVPVRYDNPDEPIVKVEIEPKRPDPLVLRSFDLQIEQATRALLEGDGESATESLAYIDALQEERALYAESICPTESLDPESLTEELQRLRESLVVCEGQLSGLSLLRYQACGKVEELRDRIKRCFPTTPTVISYELTATVLPEGTLHRFDLYDDRSDSILLNGSQRYADADTARSMAIETLRLAERPGSYANIRSENAEYSFSIVGLDGSFVADHPNRFKSYDGLIATTESVRSTLDGVLSQGTVAIGMRSGGVTLPGGDGSCFKCFGELCDLIDLHRAVLSGSTISECCDKRFSIYRTLYDQATAVLTEREQQCDALTGEWERKQEECSRLREDIGNLERSIAALGETELQPPDGFQCPTLLHRICRLSYEDYRFNRSVPGQDAVEEDYGIATDAIERRLTPIWRPDTTYCIRLTVADRVNGGGALPTTFYYGFRTAGPLGHFHTDSTVDYVEAGKNPDEYMLTGLKGYIDYGRSYPNADGELVRAKPMFYSAGRIRLFFTRSYAYHFFDEWPEYNGLPEISDSALQILIKDPAEDITLSNPPDPSTVSTAIPSTIVSWPKDDDPRIPEDIRTLLTLRNPELLNPDFIGGECWSTGGEMITPASLFVEAVPQSLKPNKLYTAIVNNVYKGSVAEVHRFVFQTSRYADFSEQVLSYRLEDREGNRRDAIFRIDAALTAADIDLMYDIVTGTLSAANASLASRWADPFDRLVEGVLKTSPPDAAIGTEFNLLRDVASEAAVALLIRNPEPLFDPKLPEAELFESLQVLVGGAYDGNYRFLVSKDRSQVLVMHPSKTIPADTLQFRFAYIAWNGTAYEEQAVVVTDELALNS